MLIERTRCLDWPPPNTARTAGPARSPKESPYYGLFSREVGGENPRTLEEYPIAPEDVVQVVLRSWSAIFESTLGDGFRIGVHIFPTPQIMGTLLLTSLSLLEIEAHTEGRWRACALRPRRTSSTSRMIDSPRRLRLIRSEPHLCQSKLRLESDSPGKKGKSGYYIAVNFDKWPVIETRPAAKQLARPSD